MPPQILGVPEPCSKRSPFFLGPILAGLASLATSCLAPQKERIDCSNALAPDQAGFTRVAALFQGSEGQGCAAGNCHGSERAEKGYRFDKNSALYDALTARMDSIYAQVASGEMPPEEETGVLEVRTWSETELRILSSWYCNGAFPND